MKYLFYLSIIILITSSCASNKNDRDVYRKYISNDTTQAVNSRFYNNLKFDEESDRIANRKNDIYTYSNGSKDVAVKTLNLELKDRGLISMSNIEANYTLDIITGDSRIVFAADSIYVDNEIKYIIKDSVGTKVFEKKYSTDIAKENKLSFTHINDDVIYEYIKTINLEFIHDISSSKLPPIQSKEDLKFREIKNDKKIAPGIIKIKGGIGITTNNDVRHMFGEELFITRRNSLDFAINSFKTFEGIEELSSGEFFTMNFGVNHYFKSSQDGFYIGAGAVFTEGDSRTGYYGKMGYHWRFFRWLSIQPHLFYENFNTKYTKTIESDTWTGWDTYEDVNLNVQNIGFMLTLSLYII